MSRPSQIGPGRSSYSTDDPSKVGVAGRSGSLELETDKSARSLGVVVVSTCLFIWGLFVPRFWHPDLESVEWSTLAVESPFWLAGLLFSTLLISAVMELFNPLIHLAVSDADIRLGGRYSVTWKLDGRFQRLRKLTILLEGSEVATYTRGTDTLTECSLFHRAVLVQESPLESAGGSFTVAIPADAMPTFRSPSNEIQWRLKVIGEISVWPDFTEEFPLEVSFVPLSEDGGHS